MCSELIFQAGRFNYVCVCTVVVFLSIIDFGLTPAHPHTPEEEVSCLAAITNTLCYCCTNWSGCSYFSPGSLLEKSELFKAAKKIWGREPPIYLQRIDIGHALSPTLHLQNAATKTYTWPTDGLSLRSSSVFVSFAARITESWNYRVQKGLWGSPSPTPRDQWYQHQQWL